MTVELDGDWDVTGLRCPACGNRGRDGDGFWVQAGVRLDGSGRPTYLLTPDYVHGEVECSRCLHSAPFTAFEPPWFRSTGWAVSQQAQNEGAIPDPLPLTAADADLEQEWLGDRLMWFCREPPS
jgi:hypothetical protein